MILPLLPQLIPYVLCTSLQHGSVPMFGRGPKSKEGYRPLFSVDVKIKNYCIKVAAHYPHDFDFTTENGLDDGSNCVRLQP